jgi:hypothetical protein
MTGGTIFGGSFKDTIGMTAFTGQAVMRSGQRKTGTKMVKCTFFLGRE